MKASQLNPICLLMKAVLHGMCESGRGRGRRASHLPKEAREPALHEGGGGGVALDLWAWTDRSCGSPHLACPLPVLWPWISSSLLSKEGGR